MVSVLVLAIYYMVCVLLLHREGLLKSAAAWIISLSLLLCAFLLRWGLLDYATLDYENFLTRWVDFFRQNGGVLGLRQSVGNYNVPYLYFLSLFSYTGYSDLHLIKFLTMAFELVLAWGVMKLAGHFTPSIPRRLAAFLATLLLPTVILNGACWGQCDAIYTALAVLSLWCALEKMPHRSLLFITLSFAFKLQAVFFMPMFLLLLTSGRIRWKQLWVVPVTYATAVLPAVLLGRPFLDTLTLYFDQAGSVGSGLNYNSSSLYAFYQGGSADETRLARLGIAAAFSFCCLLLWWLCRRGAVSDRAVLAAFVLTAICVPLFLPHMHDRYFFGADILTLALGIVCLPALPAAALTSFASLLGYYAYLHMRYLLPMRYGAVALIAAALLVLAVLARALYGSPRSPEEKKDFS